MVLADSHRISHVPRYSGYRPRHIQPAYGAITLYGPPFQVVLQTLIDSIVVLQPQPCRNKLVWAVPRSLAATRGITNCFLFLRLLRCFSSPGLPFRDMSSTCRVTPFGNLRLKDYLHLSIAYRSLSRPSSPSESLGIRQLPLVAYENLLSSTNMSKNFLLWRISESNR